MIDVNDAEKTRALFADLKAEIAAGADNDDLREYAASYSFGMGDLFDVIRAMMKGEIDPRA